MHSPTNADVARSASNQVLDEKPSSASLPIHQSLARKCHANGRVVLKETSDESERSKKQGNGKVSQTRRSRHAACPRIRVPHAHRCLNASSAVRLVGAVLILSSCAVGPDYVKPVLHVNDSWSMTGGPQISAQSAADSAWWRAFIDPARVQPEPHAAGRGTADHGSARLARNRHRQSVSTEPAGIRHL